MNAVGYVPRPEIAVPWTCGVEQIAAIRAALRKGLNPLRVEPPILPSEWAEKHFYLSEEASHTKGRQRWKSYWYQRLILNTFGNDDIEEIGVMKSARVGYTKMLLIDVGWSAHHRKVNQAIWQPTDEDRDEFVKTEIDPMIRDCDVLTDLISADNGRNKENTQSLKKFSGSLLYLRGGKAAKNYRRITIGRARIDEHDGFDRLVEKTSPAQTLAWKRTEGAPYRKLIAGSTPLDRGNSNIEDFHEGCVAKVQVNIECPSCGVDHPLVWGGKDVFYGFKWEKGRPETVRHVCPHCKTPITQRDYADQAHTSKFISRCGQYRSLDGYSWTNANGEPIRAPRSLGIHVWTAYSPQVTWQQLVEEFLQANVKAKTGDKGKLKGFVNETLGETWLDDDVDSLNRNELAARAQRDGAYPRRRVPRGGLVITAFADGQDDRWEIQWIAHGRNSETWVIDYEVVYGNPAEESEWDRMFTVMQRTFRSEHGGIMQASAYGVDTQGHFARAQAYWFIRKHGSSHKLFGTRGETTYGRPIKSRSTIVEVDYKGKTYKRGAKLWLVGTDTAKDLLFGRLGLQHPGPGYVHFPIDLDDHYYDGLTSEVRKLVDTKFGPQSRWTKKTPNARNEQLDTFVGNLFLADMLNLSAWSATMWDNQEAGLMPDLFATADMQTASGESPNLAGMSPEQTPQLAPVKIASTGSISKLFARRREQSEESSNGA